MSVARSLVGKTITKVRLNRTWNPDRKEWVCDPEIFLSDGSVLIFSVQETDWGRYGVKPVLVGPKK